MQELSERRDFQRVGMLFKSYRVIKKHSLKRVKYNSLQDYPTVARRLFYISLY